MSQLPAAVPAHTSRNLLSADVEIKGTIMFRHDLTANGRIEGEILTEGTLTIGSTGTVQGDIHAGAVSIHGRVNGNVEVKERCELKGEAQLLGDLIAPTLVMEEGATFVGRANVSPHGQPDLIPGGVRTGRRA